MENTATQQEQREQEEMWWRQQREQAARQQYEMQRRQAIWSMQQQLREINAFDTLHLLNQYGIYTLPLSQEQKGFLNQKLVQIFNDPNSEFTSVDWKTLLNVLNGAMAQTNRMQINSMGASGYNQYDNMYSNGYNYGAYPGGGYYDYGPPPFRNASRADPNEPESEEALIAKYKKYFFQMIYRVDPIIFIISLITSGYEIDKDNDEFAGYLTEAIALCLPYLNQQSLNLVYQAIDILLRQKYDTYRGERQDRGYPGSYGGYPGPGSYGPPPGAYPGSGYGPPPNNFSYGPGPGYPGSGYGPPPGAYPGPGSYGPPPNNFSYGPGPGPGYPGSGYGPPPGAYPGPGPVFGNNGRSQDYSAIW